MIELLQTLPIFSSLKKKEIKFLAEIAREVEYPPGTILLHEGDSGNCLYVIIEGRLEILKSLGTAGEYVIGFRGPGEYLGEMYLFNPERVRTASVRSLTRVHLVEISTHNFEALLNRRPELEYSLACGITQRLLDTEMMLLRTIAEKDRELAQTLTRTKSPDQEEAYGPDNLKADHALEEQDIKTETQIGTVPVRVLTFGNFQVFRGETRVPDKNWRARSPKLMLKALIARGASGVPKDLLIEDLWPQASPDSVESQFKVALHRLRYALEPLMDKSRGSSYVTLKDNLVSLRKDFCRTDLDEFLSLEKQGKKAEEAGDQGRAILCYRSAIEIYRGDFLAEDLYETWAELERYRLRTMYIDILYRTAGLYEAQGRSRKAIEYYKMIIKTDPICEAAYQKLMLIYSNGGMRAEALRAYEDCRKVLEREIGVQPGRLTSSIYRKIIEVP
ncbi:MAG: BTAD domain-containing putative transcriptional regulator [Syntrophobacteraceae bacterium]